ncbi:DNA-processing protein DprA [Changpingibacter yushuensis]|uniref:DNA-processing protein DprA n=1 Tax=Changpingibacter yushuensis TaxID=2758440 RepID=UPI0015F3740F|nr:DNA-processing protein DprA [Changpingibacter yushuensis]
MGHSETITSSNLNGVPTASPSLLATGDDVSLATGDDVSLAIDDERRAAMIWTRLAEGEDHAAVQLVEKLGYAGALDWLCTAMDSGNTAPAMRAHVERWANRVDEASFDRDRERIERIGGFMYPGDSRWPEQLNDLGMQRPLGLWFQGDRAALERVQLAMVGSRAATSYGTRMASEIAWGVTEREFGIVSGGAFGIDATAHAACVRAQGRTVVVFAGGVDKPYPTANAGLFGEVLATGGLFLSENPPGSAPLRHRFLGRNRIIAALAKACLVVEAPYRSGALSTARHALSIGRDVGAVPGPVTSPCSAGCHRLLREGAQCVTTTAEAIEMLGYEYGTSEQLGLPIPAAHDDPMSGDPVTVRVRDALPKMRPAPPPRIAQLAGVGLSATLSALGALEMAGVAEQVGGLWRLSR